MNTVLFDLDGTLLPLDQDEFIKEYFTALSKRFTHLASPRELIDSIWAATGAMVQNDGRASNADVFWNAFSKIHNRDMRCFEYEFESFYKNEFRHVSKTANPNRLADECVKELLGRGYTVALATNPIFPSVATLERIRWAGLDAEDFIYISAYENSSFCKPNPKYYEEILLKIGKNPSDCIMIGNDTREDGAAAKLSIPFFLLEGHAIEHDGRYMGYFKRGDFSSLLEYIRALPVL